MWEREEALVDLNGSISLFIGFKMDTSLRRHLDSLEGSDQKYVSRETSDFLTICLHGEDSYVGKIVMDRLTTDRVEDVRRNVISILQRLCPDTRLPDKLEIWACEIVGEQVELSQSESMPPA
ncbi:MAG: hypothetical protein OEV00_03000 [Acidobacteriota bacterium]|nr:hypothetical protein [Acidobacteriota bacterium]MDH3784276.1 hypothetical protein [Acidobacteriota bacterium]